LLPNLVPQSVSDEVDVGLKFLARLGKVFGEEGLAIRRRPEGRLRRNSLGNGTADVSHSPAVPARSTGDARRRSLDHHGPIRGLYDALLRIDGCMLMKIYPPQRKDAIEWHNGKPFSNEHESRRWHGMVDPPCKSILDHQTFCQIGYFVHGAATE
jgi:hypothetical protein